MFPKSQNLISFYYPAFSFLLFPAQFDYKFSKISQKLTFFPDCLIGGTKKLTHCKHNTYCCVGKM
jgi:hypothetical protein